METEQLFGGMFMDKEVTIDIDIESIFIEEHKAFDFIHQDSEKIQKRLELFLKIMGDQLRVEVLEANEVKVREITTSFFEFMMLLNLANKVCFDEELKETFEL